MSGWKKAAEVTLQGTTIRYASKADRAAAFATA